MTSRAEDVLFYALTDTDQLERLVTMGVDLEAIPTEMMRPVVTWAIERFFESGRTIAPSRSALLETWGTQIDDARVELLPEDEDADNIEWAVSWLHSHLILRNFQQVIKVGSEEMALASIEDRPNTLAATVDMLFELSQRVQPRHLQRSGVEGLDWALRDYTARAQDGHQPRGVAFGLPAVDEHTFHIHPGELAVLAAPPKTGKSFMLDRIALHSWVNQHKTVVLFTLENSVEMTWDRIICMHFGISYKDWQRGRCTPEQLHLIREFRNRVADLPGQLHVIQPKKKQRTMGAMVQLAQTLGADAILIDQLTFVKHPSPGKKSKPEIIGELMHDLKEAISVGGTPIPCVLAHQINRDGVKAARKTGFMDMEHLAEGSEVERTADWVFGLYQGSEQKRAGEALLQIMASRREETKAWEIIWEPARAMVSVIREKELEE